MTMNTLPFAILGDIGGPELLLILFIVLLLFGGEKLPQLARGLGKSVREFKKATGDVQNELKRAIEESDQPTSPVAPPPAGAPKASTPTEPLPYDELKPKP